MIGVIGGSQAYDLLSSGRIAGKRLGSIQTPFGDSQPIIRVNCDSLEYIFLSRHGEAGYSISAPFVNYRANIWALKELGVERVIAWSGPGAINHNLRPGDFVVPDDLIDETRRRTYTFFEGKGVGFVRQNPVFCPQMTQVAVRAFERLGLSVNQGGTYVCTEGPRLETPAEIRKFRLYRADLVGMTLVPEVFLAKELEMCYLPICYVSNYAEGVREADFVSGQLFEGLLSPDEKQAVQDAVVRFPEIIHEVVTLLANEERTCNCPHLMDRYRLRGDLSADWHEWIT